MGQFGNSHIARKKRNFVGAQHFCLAVLFAVFAALPTGTIANADEGELLTGMALVIGQSNYKRIDLLANPVNDANKIDALLTGLGFATDVSLDRNTRQLRRDIDRFVEDVEADDADVALIYYSGHGVEAGGENYLVPIDSDASSLEDGLTYLVPISEVLERLQSKAKITILLLDACRTNPFPDGALLKTSATPEGVPVMASGLGAPRGMFMIRNTDEDGPDSLGVVVGFAAEPGNAALDGEPEGNSPYAAALIKHFAARGVAFGDVMTLVTEEVYLTTKTRQRPWTNASLRRLLYFGGGAKEETGDNARLRSARRDLLLTISATPKGTRAVIERLAQKDKLPLDILYGMLKELQVDTSAGPSKVVEQLRVGAANLKKFLAERVIPNRTDPELVRLSEFADRAQSEGAIALAKEYRARASARADELSDVLDEGEKRLEVRRLELATTYAEEAETAILAFDYDTAENRYVAAYEQAIRAHSSYGDALASLFNLRLGDVYATVGDSAAALASYRDGLSIVRRLASADPSNWTWNSDLSQTHAKVGGMQIRLGEHKAALASFNASLSIARRLVATYPHISELQYNLSVAYRNAAQMHLYQGDFERYLEFTRKSADILEKMNSKGTDNTYVLAELSATYIDVGNSLKTQGDFSDALIFYLKSVATLERLLASDPNNVDWQFTLSSGYISVAGESRLRGNFGEALRTYKKAINILERLVTVDPGNSSWQVNLADAYSAVAAVQEEAGEHISALSFYDRGIAIRMRLALVDPVDWSLQIGLAESYADLGDIQKIRGEYAKAIAHFRESIAISKRYLAANPNALPWDLLLAQALLGLGETFMLDEEFAEATSNLQDGISIIDRLAGYNPENAILQALLAIAHAIIGELHMTQKDFSRGQMSFELSLGIMGPIAASDSDSAVFERGLAEVLIYCARGYYKADRALKGLSYVERALALFPIEASAYEVRGQIYESLDRPGEAIADFRKALDLNPSLWASKEGLARLEGQ